MAMCSSIDYELLISYLVYFMPVKNSDVVLITIDYTLSYYILWGFISCSELHNYEDIRWYFGLEEPCLGLKFLLILVEYNG